MRYTHKNIGTCSTSVSFDLENGIISNVQFIGGCNGNLKSISSLVEGQKAQEVAKKLNGITCNDKPTSCGDQFAKAIAEAIKENELTSRV